MINLISIFNASKVRGIFLHNFISLQLPSQEEGGGGGGGGGSGEEETCAYTHTEVSRDSVVGIVTGYELDD
jgi:hypothetical protein